ncbi:hypothetical protein, partial [Chimaeribacter arupi]|uniref:hypothetical protein n=1 Tax=Chimaeribacter arupi TaxID=2060066 RepID=UPI0013FD0ED8
WPCTVEKKLELYVFSNAHGFYGLEEKDEYGKTLKYGSQVAEEASALLGYDIAVNYPHNIDIIIHRSLTEIIDQWRMIIFAENLTINLHNRQGLIEKINTKISTIGMGKINTSFICGVMRGLVRTDSNLMNTVLDRYLENPAMDSIFPYIQLSIPLDEIGIGRIKKHLDKENLNVYGYSNLAIGERHKAITEDR